jgi:hypothetical protein
MMNRDNLIARQRVYLSMHDMEGNRLASIEDSPTPGFVWVVVNPDNIKADMLAFCPPYLRLALGREFAVGTHQTPPMSTTPLLVEQRTHGGIVLTSLDPEVYVPIQRTPPATPAPDADALTAARERIAGLERALREIANHRTPVGGDQPRLLDAYMEAYFYTKSLANKALDSGLPDGKRAAASDDDDGSEGE